jgi:PAS domain S-box-containing protein
MNTHQASNSLYARVGARVAHWITPVDAPPGNAERRRIQLIAVLLLLCALSSTVMAALFFLAEQTTGSLGLLTTLIFWGLYAGTRFISYRVGLLALIFQGILPYLLYLNQSAGFSLLILFGTILTNILLSSLFSRTRLTLFAIVANLAVALVFFITTDTLSWFHALNFVALVVVVGVFLLLYTYISNRDLEQTRESRDALRDSEERFRIVSDLMNDYAYALHVDSAAATAGDTPATHFEWITGNVQQITGHTQQHVMNLPDWSPLLHPNDLPIYQQRQQRLLNGGAAEEIDVRLIQPGGNVRVLRDNARAIRDDSGQTRAIYGAVHDVTEENEARESLQMHLVQQAVVAELGLLAMSQGEMHTLLNHTVVLIQQVLPVDTCLIFACDPVADTCHIEAASGHDPALDDTIMSSDPTQSQVGYTLHSGEPVIVEDYRSETRFTPWHDLAGRGFVSGLSIIIQGQEQPYGVLSVHTKERRRFSEDDTYFLQSIVNIIGTFLENTRARRAEREQRDLAEALRDATLIINSEFELPVVLEKIQEFLARLVPAQEMSSIILLTGDGEHYRVASVRGVDEGESAYLRQKIHPLDRLPLLHRVVKTGEPFIMDDFRNHPEAWVKLDGLTWVQSYLGAPINVQGRCIGVLSLNSSEAHAFTPEDARLLQTFADKTGNAILNARRAEELEAMVEERTQELLQERQQMQAILDGTGEGIFYAEDTRISYANQALSDITGYTVGEFIGRSSSFLLPDDSDDDSSEGISTLDHIPQVVADGGTWRDEVVLQRADDTTFEAGLTISQVGSREDDKLRTVTIVRDISREKALERQKTRFIANAAHELRSPVTSLNTRLYLIRKQPENRDHHLQRLEKVSLRMNRLISDLLDMASFEQGQIQLRRESIILQDVLQDTLDMHAAEADLEGIKIQADMPVQPLHLLADPHRLQQVFTNLLTNAIHYTPEAGQIDIEVRPQTDSVQITFRDTGAGIPADELPHIFQPFYRVTREKKGTGLGLSIAREIVEQHNGTIQADSTEGSGSTFQIMLPCFTPGDATDSGA